MADDSDLTADVSDEEKDELETAQDDSFDVPIPSLPTISEIDRRLSASQPALNEARTRKHFSSLSCLEENDGFPFLQVKEDNERLKRELLELREQLSDTETCRRFAEEQLDLSVREILDDYLRLQRLVRDSDDKAANYDNLENECTKLQKENQRLQKAMDDAALKYDVQLQHRQQEIDRLRQELIGNDEFTLNSEYDAGNKTINLELNQQKIMNEDYLKKIAKLEEEVASYKERLSDVERAQLEKADTSVARTFVMSENEQLLAKRNEELITEKAEAEHKYWTCNKMLMVYMNRLNKVEKNLMLSALSSSQFNLSTSFDSSDKQHIENVLEKMKKELLAEKDKNRNLRKEVNHLMGKDTSSASSDSVEAATEALEGTAFEEQIKDEIVGDLEGIMAKLNKIGIQEQSVNNELLDTIDRGDPIDLHNRSQEMIDRFGQLLPAQPQLLPDVEQLSLLNSSLGNILTTSMNAAHDITIVKENLESFRGTLIAMFDRLKSSAALFDEIRQVLSNGEPNPLVDQIRDMQLLWNIAATKVGDVSKVIDAAERSIIGMQGHISVLEQTIVNTTFVLDQTRRITFSNLSLVSRLGQGDPSVAEDDKIGELEEQIKELNEHINNLTESRDSAKAKIEHCENQYRDSELEKDQLFQELEDLKIEYSRLETEKNRNSDDLNMLNKDHIHIKSLLDRHIAELDRDKNTIVNLEAEIADVKSTVGILTVVRDDMMRQLIDRSAEVDQAKTDAKSREEARLIIEQRLEELQTAYRDLQKASEESQDINSRQMSDLEQIHRSLKSKIELLEEQLAAARENNKHLQKEIKAAQEFGKELDLHTNSPHTWPSTTSTNTSLLYKETMPQVSTQTMFNLESIKALEENQEKLENDLQSLLSIYAELEVALRGLVFTTESGVYNPVKDVRGAKKSCDKLKRAIAEQATYDAKTKEQVERISEDLAEIENRSGSIVPRKNVSSKFTTTAITENYQSRLSRDINVAFIKTMDLAYNLKVAVDAKNKNYEFDLERLNEDAKAIRMILYETKNYLSTKFDKEGLQDQSNDVIAMLKSLDRDNRELFEKLTDTMSKYRDLKKSSSNPDVLSRIDQELLSIHDVMKRTRDVVAPLTRRN